MRLNNERVEPGGVDCKTKDRRGAAGGCPSLKRPTRPISSSERDMASMNTLPTYPLRQAGPQGDFRGGVPRLARTLLENFGVVAGVLILASAVLWAAGEHSRHQADLRRAELNRHLTAFKSAPVADAWQRIAAAWEAQRPRQAALLGRMATLSDASRQAELRNYRAFVLEVVDEHDLARDIDTVLGFYGRVATCVQFGSCDAGAAAGAFGSEAWSFRDQHYYYLQDEYRVDEIDRVIDTIAPRAGALGDPTLS